MRGRWWLVREYDRWRCKAAVRQACSNGTITGAQLESRAVEGLRGRLLTLEVISRFAQHLQRELDAQQHAAHGTRDEIETTLEDTRLWIANIVKRIEKNDDVSRSRSTRLTELEAGETRLEESLATRPDRVVVRLPANYEAVYRAAITQLEQHLATPEAASQRHPTRALIEAVVVHAGDSRGGKIRSLELHGNLFWMSDFAEAAVGGRAH